MVLLRKIQSLPFINTSTTGDEYSRSIRENLPLPIQRQLSEKLNTFSDFFIAFLECALNLEHFEKKWASWLKYFWSYWLWKTCILKCIKGLVSENLSVVSVLTSSNGLNLDFTLKISIGKKFINDIYREVL